MTSGLHASTAKVVVQQLGAIFAPSPQCLPPPPPQPSSSTQSPACLLPLHPALGIRQWVRYAALHRENGNSAVQDLANFYSASVPVQGPFPPLSPSVSLLLDEASPLVKVYDLRNITLPLIPFSDGPAFINADIQPRRHISSRPRQRRRRVQYQHLWLLSPVHPSSPFSSNRSSARHHLLHHINRRVIQRHLPGLWRRSRYNPSPHSSRRVIKAFL